MRKMLVKLFTKILEPVFKMLFRFEDGGIIRDPSVPRTVWWLPSEPPNSDPDLSTSSTTATYLQKTWKKPSNTLRQ